MRAQEFISEAKATAKTCRKGKEGKDIGISARSSCRAQGLMTRRTGHTDGTGRQGKKGSGKRLDGTRSKSEIYGGPVRDYSGKSGKRRGKGKKTSAKKKK
jgi:hypothetical protein